MDPSPPSGTKPKDETRRRRGNREQLAFYETPPDVKTSVQIVNEAKQELMLKQSHRGNVKGVKTNRPFTPRDEERTLFGGASSSDYTDRPTSAISIDSQFLEGLDSRPSSAVSGARVSSGFRRPRSGVSSVSGSPQGAYVGSQPSPTDPLGEGGLTGSSFRPTSASSDSSLGIISGTSGSTSASSRSGRSSVKLSPLPNAPEVGDRSKTAGIPRPPSGDPRRRLRARANQLKKEALDAGQEGSEPTTSRSESLGDLKHSDDKKLVGDRRVHSGPKERTGSLIENEAKLKQKVKGLSLEERGEGDGQEVTSPNKNQRKASSAGKLTSNNEYIECSIQPLIDILRLTDAEDSVISDTCDQIYEILDSAHLLGKASSKRTYILKAVFKLMETTNPKMLLSLARLTLALRVSGKHLTTVCKIVFKVSRDRNNDQLFIASNILDLMFDTMINMDSGQSGDALLFSCGAIKFLASNAKLSKTLSKRCTLYTLASILSKTNKLILDSTRGNERMVQVLVQLTTALRRFAEQPAFISQFVSHSIIDELCVTSVACSSEYDLMINISSTLSKLTEHTGCCEILSKHPLCYRSLLKLLTTYTHKEELVLRICFVLGNLADQDNTSRLLLFHEKDSVHNLVNVLEHYLQLSFKDTSEGSKHSVIDVLSKLIRVIANMSVSEDVGVSLCDDKNCVESLLRIIDIKDISGHEELVLNSMTTVNNLCFFSSPGTAMEDSQVETSRCLMKMLLKDHKEGLSEACRIYGNLTRSRLVRDFLSANSVLEIMVTLLDSNDQDLVYFCCGVLVNFMLDEDKRPVLKRENGIAKLLDVLNDYAIMDWQLAGLVCQVLWNYSTNIRSSNLTFGESESQQLVSLLTDYIDNPHLPVEGSASTDMRRYLHESWSSDFCSVAALLRKRVKHNQSKFVELSPPTSAS